MAKSKSKVVETPVKAKRGRPVGSKNKTVLDKAPASAELATLIAQSEVDCGEVFFEVPKAVKFVTKRKNANGEDTKSEDGAITKEERGLFYLKFHDGALLDPFETVSTPGRKLSEYKFRQVSEEAYVAYGMYLKTKNPARFRAADSKCKGVQ